MLFSLVLWSAIVLGFLTLLSTAQRGEPSALGETTPWHWAKELAIPALVSLAIVGVALFIVLTGRADSEQKWAYGVMGALIGFWLRR